MSSSRVLTNMQGISHTHSERLSTTLGVNCNTSDDNNNPQLSSEPNVIIRNRFKALAYLSEDSGEKEHGVAYYGSVAKLKEVDKEENNENEQSIEITRLGSKDKIERKEAITEQQNVFLEQLSKVVLGAWMPK